MYVVCPLASHLAVVVLNHPPPSQQYSTPSFRPFLVTKQTMHRTRFFFWRQHEHIRLKEADRALSQALRLGLADPTLLRELGNCYVAVGRLDAAEEALRMSLAAEVNGNGSDGAGGGRSGGGGNPHTRRRLADVLSARNATSQVLCGNYCALG